MTDQAHANDPLIGQLVTGRYRIVRKLGEGGMGTVYEGFHEAIEKRIALKILHAEYSSSPDVISRFKQEAISASRIKHQHVIDVFDFGQLEGGACFIAMEFLDGMDLGDALTKRGHYDADGAIRIAVQVCRALGLAHARGVVHRDLKPENVFLQRTPEGDEMVKIVDFGIAQLRKNDEVASEQRQRRLTKTGMIFGTPEYMAPEQARGQDVDQRSDIYALGIILYEMLTGALPFVGESFLEVLNKHTMARVPAFSQVNDKLTYSHELENAVRKALEKEADDRYPTMQEFSAALLRTPEGRNVRAHISSITSKEEVDGNESMRIENQQHPHSSRGAGTAVLGSAGERPATAAIEIPTHSSRGLILGVVGAAAVFLGVVGFAVFGRHKPQPAPLAQPAAVAEPNETQPPEPSPAPSAEVAPQPETAPTSAVLHITTEPEGAVVEKDGFQVCDASPCDVTINLGEAVTLSAHKGAMKGEARVLVQGEQKVSIALKSAVTAPRPRAPAPAAAPAPAPTPAMCEVMVDGLKILRPCN